MSDALKLLEWLNEECCALQPIAVATGGGDHDVHWIVISYQMSDPCEVTIGEGASAMAAIEDAMKASDDPTRWRYVPPEFTETANDSAHANE